METRIAKPQSTSLRPVVPTPPPTIVIACGFRKLDTIEPVPAADLYTGSLFRSARRAAEARTKAEGEWLILSAKHGLIQPAAPVTPYERTVRTKADIEELAHTIAAQSDPGLVEVWAPARYRQALEAAGRQIISAPLTGMGIGHQLHWLKETTDTAQGGTK